MSRRGFTMIELMVASGISVFVLSALSLVYFMTLNYYRTVLAETLQPTTARALRDRLYFRLADGGCQPTGMGLLSFSEGQISHYALNNSGNAGMPPPQLCAVHMPIELKFETGWGTVSNYVRQVTNVTALSFRPRGVLQGGTTNRCELLLYLTPFGASQPMATANGTSRNSDRGSACRPGDRGSVL